MAAPGYRWHVGQLTTGKIVRQVDVESGSWSTSFAYGTPGKVEFTVPLRALNADRTAQSWVTARADTAPVKAFAAVSYVDAAGTETFLEAGPIWTRSFDDDTGTLRVGAAGLSTYFDHRKAIDVFTSDPWAEWSETFDGPQLGLIAKRYVELVQYTLGESGLTEDEGANSWLSLPIVLPDDADLGGTSPATHTRTLYGYELAWLGQKLADLTTVIDGPEIQFVPRRNSDDPRYLEWVMRIGVADTDYMLTQAGNDWTFDRSVPKSPVRNISVAEDASGFARNVWAGGQGQAEGRPIAVGANDDGLELLNAGYPLLDGEVTATDSVSETTTLQSHADLGAVLASRPREAWQMRVSREGAPDVGKYRAGDWARVRVGGRTRELPTVYPSLYPSTYGESVWVGDDDEWFAAGEYPSRILALSGSASSAEVAVVLSERVSEV